MIKTKTKRTRFLIGSTLAVVFSIKFLLIGIGGFFIANYFSPVNVKAELLNKQIPNDFVYETDTLNNLRKLDYPSFLGKPVKIPFENKNPEGVPGADRDYLIIFPPRILDKNASVPLRAAYFSSGKEINSESAQLVKNVEQFVNSVGDNNPVMLEIIKNLIESNLKISLNEENCKSLACYVPLLLQIAHAETDTNPLLTTDDLSQLTDSLGDLDTSNPQVKQLLVLVLLLIMVNQSMAESLNSDKQACLDSGGDWINGVCESEEKSTCEDNGGTFRKFTNQCLIDKQSCDNEDLQCTDEKDTDEDGNEITPYGCACKSGSCLNEDGICAPKNNSKKKACENSGGTWRSFSDAEELCSQKCGATQTSCMGAAASSSQNLMGCDCSEATGTGSQWTQGNTNAAGKCLATSGACIAKDTSKDDDDKDGVPNGQDRCPNSTPDGSGTVNMNLGSADAGCTCTQLQAMGRIPQRQQQQCPPDGCESGTPYMVKYDRSQQQYLNQTNQNPLCQNGIIQQQQQQQQLTCQVISREPTDQCEREMERKNNQNKNDNLQDMLKKLLNDKKKQDQDKKNQGDKGNNQGTSPGQQDQQQQPPKTDDQTKPPVPGGTSAAIDPKGPGEYNAKQDGTPSKPYALHASQFKKICGENTYVLTNAKPGGGDFKNDPSKASTVTPGNIAPNELLAGLNKLNTCPSTGGCNVPTDMGQRIKNATEQVKDKWGKLDQDQQKKVMGILNGNGDPVARLNNTILAVNQAYSENQKKTQTPVQNNNNGKGAKSMNELNEPGAYFKVPKCEELAKTHCCVCSCCDKKDDNCGWAIGEKCNQSGDKGTCEGEKCAKAPTKCDEKPELSIKINWGKKFNECSKEGDKKATSQEKCKDYTKSTHNEGACRYDCEGSPKGCEEGSGSCKIIIEGQEIQRFNDERWPTLQISPDPKAQFTEFTNKKEGSTVQPIGTTQPSEVDWIKNLEKKEGQACKCRERDKSKNNPEDKPEGYKHPEGTPTQQQQQQQEPASGYNPPGNTGEDWWSNMPNPSSAQPQPATTPPQTPPSVTDSNYWNTPEGQKLLKEGRDEAAAMGSTYVDPKTNSIFPDYWNTTEGQKLLKEGRDEAAAMGATYTDPTTNITANTNQPITASQQMSNTWKAVKNFFKEIWNWGTFKHANE